MVSSSPDGHGHGDGPSRLIVPADIDTPDTIAWGLSFRQLAVLATPVAGLYVAYSRFGSLLPQTIWVTVAIAVLAGAVVVALGTRDGLPLGTWIRHGLLLRATPTLATPGGPPTGPPLLATGRAPQVPSSLRPEVTSIDAHGTLVVDGARRSVIACGTISVGLRTGTEQTALLEAFGRWLNALNSPAQIVISAARHDLTPLAEQVLDDSIRLNHPALQAAAHDYAAFLLELDLTREPLRRQVLTVLTSSPNQHSDVRALTSLGISARPLDGPAVAAALAAAVDPYDPPVPGPRAVPGVPVTAHASALIQTRWTS